MTTCAVVLMFSVPRFCTAKKISKPALGDNREWFAKAFLSFRNDACEQ